LALEQSPWTTGLGRSSRRCAGRAPKSRMLRGSRSGKFCCACTAARRFAPAKTEQDG
jgi:hypothetical protein